MHQAVPISTSSEAVLLQTVFVASFGICVDMLKARCPAALTKTEGMYWNAFRKIARVASSIKETLARCPIWGGRPFLDKLQQSVFTTTAMLSAAMCCGGDCFVHGQEAR